MLSTKLVLMCAMFIILAYRPNIICYQCYNTTDGGTTSHNYILGDASDSDILDFMRRLEKRPLDLLNINYSWQSIYF